MTLDALSVFLTVAEEMNFTKAARKLYMTQQSLSGHIKRLESQYGVKLFDRRPTLRLTAEGEAFVFYARQMLTAERNLIDAFADISQSSIGYLDMGLSRQRSGVFFEDIFNRFHPKYPNIDIRLHEENTAGLLNLLQQGEICLMVGIDVAPSSRYHTETLSNEKMRCVVTRSLIKQYYGSESSSIINECYQKGCMLEKLSLLPLIVLPEGNRFRKTVNSVFKTAGIMPHIILESNEQELSLRLALSNVGMALVSPVVLYDCFHRKKELPEDLLSFEVVQADRNVISMVSSVEEDGVHFVETMKQAIRETFDDYNKAMHIKCTE